MLVIGWNGVKVAVPGTVGSKGSCGLEGFITQLEIPEQPVIKKADNKASTKKV